MNKTNRKTIRSSNLELLRILCVIFIIADHFVSQGQLSENTQPVYSIFYSSATSLSRVACSIFVIISAWFSVDKPFKFERIAHTWLTVVTIALPIAIYCFCINLSTEQLIVQSLLPASESPLWFAGYFIILLMVSPFLNHLLNKMPRKFLEYLILGTSVFLVFYPTISGRLGVLSHDIFTLIFIYTLTGYIKKYKSVPHPIKALVTFAIVWGILTLARSYVAYYQGVKPWILLEIQSYSELYRARLQTLPNLIMSYSLFFVFLGLKLKYSKFINICASASLGVYCIHQVPIWYTHLWEDLLKTPIHTSQLWGYKRMFYVVCAILSIWFVFTLIELARNKLVSFAIESRSWYLKLCNRVNGIVNSIEHDSLDKSEHKFMKRALIVISVYLVCLASIQHGSFEQLFNLKNVSTYNAIDENLDLIITEDLTYSDHTLSGAIFVRNNGKKIIKVSNGIYPVNIGIHIVSPDGEIIVSDYLHLPIKERGSFEENEVVTIPIYFENVDQYLDSGYGFRFEAVQEGVRWFDSTALYYWGD